MAINKTPIIMNNPENILHFDLGFVGHNAEKFQNLFGYMPEPNEYGYFLRFENYSLLECNQGVYCVTNCFESEEEFNQVLNHKLLGFFIMPE